MDDTASHQKTRPHEVFDLDLANKNKWDFPSKLTNRSACPLGELPDSAVSNTKAKRIQVLDSILFPPRRRQVYSACIDATRV
jgi:hypothetical protein